MVGAHRFELTVQAPFRLDLTVWALRRRAHNDVDRFDEGVYRRVLPLGARTFETAVRQTRGGTSPRLAVELTGRGSPPSDAVEAEARSVLRQVLGLDVNIGGFYEVAERDQRLTVLAARFKGMRPPRFASMFEALVNAVACQQLSLTVGIHLLNRLAAGYGPTLTVAGADTAGFPEPDRLAGIDPGELRPLGFSAAKARAIVKLAEQMESGQLDFAALEDASDDAACAALMGIPGVGRWSAEYTLLRGLGRLQVLPGDDVGARNNLKRRFGLSPAAGYSEVAALSESWWPYGGLVYFHLLLDALSDAGTLSENTIAPLPSLAKGHR